MRQDEVDDLTALINRLVQMEIEVGRAQLERDAIRRQLACVLLQLTSGRKDHDPGRDCPRDRPV